MPNNNNDFSNQSPNSEHNANINGQGEKQNSPAPQQQNNNQQVQTNPKDNSYNKQFAYNNSSFQNTSPNQAPQTQAPQAQYNQTYQQTKQPYPDRYSQAGNTASSRQANANMPNGQRQPNSNYQPYPNETKQTYPNVQMDQPNSYVHYSAEPGNANAGNDKQKLEKQSKSNKALIITIVVLVCVLLIAIIAIAVHKGKQVKDGPNTSDNSSQVLSSESVTPESSSALASDKAAAGYKRLELKNISFDESSELVAFSSDRLANIYYSDAKDTRPGIIFSTYEYFGTVDSSHNVMNGYLASRNVSNFDLVKTGAGQEFYKFTYTIDSYEGPLEITTYAQNFDYNMVEFNLVKNTAEQDQDKYDAIFEHMVESAVINADAYAQMDISKEYPDKAGVSPISFYNQTVIALPISENSDDEYQLAIQFDNFNYGDSAEDELLKLSQSNSIAAGNYRVFFDVTVHFLGSTDPKVKTINIADTDFHIYDDQIKELNPFVSTAGLKDQYFDKELKTGESFTFRMSKEIPVGQTAYISFMDIPFTFPESQDPRAIGSMSTVANTGSTSSKENANSQTKVIKGNGYTFEIPDYFMKVTEEEDSSAFIVMSSKSDNDPLSYYYVIKESAENLGGSSSTIDQVWKQLETTYNATEFKVEKSNKYGTDSYAEFRNLAQNSETGDYENQFFRAIYKDGQLFIIGTNTHSNLVTAESEELAIIDSMLKSIKVDKK